MFKPPKYDVNAAFAADSRIRAKNNESRSWEQAYRNRDAEYDRLAEKYQMWIKVIEYNAEANIYGSTGMTWSGYTNAPYHELRLYMMQMVAEITGNQLAGLQMPYGYWPVRQNSLASLTDAQRKEINLRLLCRMEWIDYGLHSSVMAKFGAMLVEALLSPTKENAHLRTRGLNEAFVKEQKAYNAICEQAQDVTQGERVRAEFEAERYAFWKGKLRYSYIDNKFQPSAIQTRKAIPDIRTDLHLPAGRLARDFGINIATGKPATCYSEWLATGVQSGSRDAKMATWVL